MELGSRTGHWSWHSACRCREEYKNVKVLDISVPISAETPVYAGDPHVKITPDSRIASGGSSNVSILEFGSHTATHVDPPYHMLDDGIKIDELSLDAFIGECLVCDVGDVRSIGAAELDSAGIPAGTERIIFKSRNSELWKDTEFHEDFTYLAPDGADWLLARGIRLVGVDYLSIDKFHSVTHPTHCRLLGAGVAVVEGLCLLDVPADTYTLVCLPLRIKDGDGAPARAVLLKK
jgi:arylformamidase